MTKSRVCAFMAHPFSEVLGRVREVMTAGRELIVSLGCDFCVVVVSFFDRGDSFTMKRLLRFLLDLASLCFC